jgi:hypothetical protein
MREMSGPGTVTYSSVAGIDRAVRQRCGSHTARPRRDAPWWQIVTPSTDIVKPNAAHTDAIARHVAQREVVIPLERKAEAGVIGLTLPCDGRAVIGRIAIHDHTAAGRVDRDVRCDRRMRCRRPGSTVAESGREDGWPNSIVWPDRRRRAMASRSVQLVSSHRLVLVLAVLLTAGRLAQPGPRLPC